MPSLAENKLSTTSTSRFSRPMDLSVITVCFNAAAVLPRCIASVAPLLRQKELSVEYLVIDGASTDNTVEILRQAQQAGDISRFITEPDQGIYDAMNKGILLANGSICVFINADDEILADAVPACCAPILEGKAHATFSTALMIKEDKNQRFDFSPCLDFPFLQTPCNHQAFYCSTDWLRRMQGFQWRDFPIVADSDLMHRLLLDGAIISQVPKQSCRFRIGGTSSGQELHSDYLRFAEKYQIHILKKATNNVNYTQKAIGELLRHAAYCYCIGSDTSDTNCRAIELLLQELGKLLPQKHRQMFSHILQRKAFFRFLSTPFKNPRKREHCKRFCSNNLWYSKYLKNI